MERVIKCLEWIDSADEGHKVEWWGAEKINIKIGMINFAIEWYIILINEYRWWKERSWTAAGEPILSWRKCSVSKLWGRNSHRSNYPLSSYQLSH